MRRTYPCPLSSGPGSVLELGACPAGYTQSLAGIPVLFDSAVPSLCSQNLMGDILLLGFYKDLNGTLKENKHPEKPFSFFSNPYLSFQPFHPTWQCDIEG